MVNTTFGYWLINKHVCTTLYLGQLGSVGAGGLISCRILLKISIEHTTVLPCVTIPVEFIKTERGPSLRTDTQTYTDTQK